ncbi:MAG: lysine--tRNA ligase [Thermotogae bacterium]|nr:lysine--tRNA ligase [Thermotogota bacterium]
MASSEYEVRLKKLNMLRDLGVSYPYRYDITHTVDELKENFREGLEVRIAGRVMTKRPFGKLIFSHIRGDFTDLQIMVQRGRTPEDFFVGLELARYEGSKNPAKIYEKLVDIGDVVGIEGHTLRTKTGEPTVLVKKLTLLVKSLHPLPEKWHGIQDPELKYRKRYLYLITSLEARRHFYKRFLFLKETRRFFEDRGFVELETPILQPIYGGATARPFKTYSNALETDLYLRIATEISLKKLLVGGFSRIYEIGKNFRNEGIDSTHYPEFTALEAYAAFWDYGDIMDLTEEYFNTMVKLLTGGNETFIYGGQEINAARPFQRISFVDALNERLSFDVLSAPYEKLLKVAEKEGIKIKKPTRAKLYDKLFDHFVGDRLKNPTFVIDHPLELSPFARKHRSKEGVVERFELFVAGMEVANAFSELNDPHEQRDRLLKEVELRKVAKDEELPEDVDWDFIEALEYGMPPTGGLGLGLDRIFMLITSSDNIRDVIPLPVLRPKREE